jgi:outer membrane protein OmpA-like peptidoglycan-associated protein
MTDYLLQLHDDALISIGEYVGKLYGPETYVRLGQTCKRMKRLLLPDDEDASAQTIQNIIRLRMAHYTAQRLMPRDFSINSLKDLAVFETWCETPLHDDNRIPFQFASVNIHEGMRDKIFAIIGIMKRYGSVRVQLDSHCGIIAPNSVASSFSRSRGHSIKRVLDDPSRVEVIGWGKRIANKVARSNTHPFGELARQGRGWVEVYIVLGDGDDNSNIMLPPRHEYYNSDLSTTDDDVDEAVMDPEILHEFWQHHLIHSRR